MANTYVPPRGPDGKIAIEPAGFRAMLAQSMDDVGATPPEGADQADQATPASWRGPWAAAIGGVLIAAALIAAIRAFTPAAPPVPVPTRPPAATAPAVTLPPAAVGLPRAVVAFAAPAGDVLGSIEPGRPYTPTGQFADGWLQLDVAGSGAIWLRGSDLPEVPLPTATPTPTPAPTATPAPTSVYVPPPPTPIPPPPPTTCAANLYGVACGTGNVQATADAIQAAAEATSAVQRATLQALPTATPFATVPAAQTVR